jgi:hypothetical protein
MVGRCYPCGLLGPVPRFGGAFFHTETMNHRRLSGTPEPNNEVQAIPETARGAASGTPDFKR